MPYSDGSRGVLSISDSITPDIKKIQKALIQWGKKNYEKFPWRNTTNMFHALIAELMLQRTRAEQVVPIYENFVRKYPSLKSAKVDEESLRKILLPLGLNWRIQNIIDLTKDLVETQQVPDDYHELIRFHGVGDYVASAFLSFHRDQFYPIIDSNAVRLWGRVFDLDVRPETRRKKSFRRLVQQITPENHCKAFNYTVLDLTRTRCKPKPLCNMCPLDELCIYGQRLLNSSCN